MHRLWLAAAVTAMLAPSPAWANFMTGTQYLERCAPGTEDSFCFGYVAGVIDRWEAEGSEKVCLPLGRVPQFADAASTYIADNPDQAHLPASVLVLDAMRAAYPCP